MMLTIDALHARPGVGWAEVRNLISPTAVGACSGAAATGLNVRCMSRTLTVCTGTGNQVSDIVDRRPGIAESIGREAASR
jgi:hypothetical protein